MTWATWKSPVLIVVLFTGLQKSLLPVQSACQSLECAALKARSSFWPLKPHQNLFDGSSPQEAMMQPHFGMRSGNITGPYRSLHSVSTRVILSTRNKDLLFLGFLVNCIISQEHWCPQEHALWAMPSSTFMSHGQHWMCACSRMQVWITRSLQSPILGYLWGIWILWFKGTSMVPIPMWYMRTIPIPWYHGMENPYHIPLIPIPCYHTIPCYLIPYQMTSYHTKWPHTIIPKLS